MDGLFASDILMLIRQHQIKLFSRSASSPRLMKLAKSTGRCVARILGTPTLVLKIACSGGTLVAAALAAAG